VSAPWYERQQNHRARGPRIAPGDTFLLLLNYLRYRLGHVKETNMRIVCTTASAAGQVLTILLNAQLRPLHDFEIRPVLSTTPPITYTMLVALTAAQLTQIRAIPDTTITD
jgi:hypothetical protein